MLDSSWSSSSMAETEITCCRPDTSCNLVTSPLKKSKNRDLICLKRGWESKIGPLNTNIGLRPTWKVTFLKSWNSLKLFSTKSSTIS
ncbi:hypothetical protein OGAPHI_005205 [Ogataea philodendri]|uniref:Uncharacterized protein n=1 Tax=Ogataea philodendri TaxID=1378263 RepID=A0A9P8P265_9ASCO|nr:uncharacterized protein OGAPHI_005205 [Ogataea philodendri]KAH3663802.1 hypothetical protein OGAPHI_005205 [Ogataea philodendri]